MQILENKSNYIVMQGTNEIHLYSYSTNVARYDVTLNLCWIDSNFYSKTTSKHINKFKADYLKTDTKIINN